MDTLSERDAGHIEGYATALQDILRAITGEDTCAKMYDPMTVREDRISSYAYDLKTGSRGHPLADFESIEEIKALMLKEVIAELLFEDVAMAKADTAPTPAPLPRTI